MNWNEAMRAMRAMEQGAKVRRPSWNPWIKWALQGGQVVQLGGIEFNCVTANTHKCDRHTDWEIDPRVWGV